MRSSILSKRILHGLILWLFLSNAACRSQTPPGPTIVHYTLEGAACTFFVWPQGLRLMLWVDIIDAGNENSTSDPLFRLDGYALANDGRRVEWQLSTAHGQTATLHIDAQQPDLARGELFLITTAGGSTQIQQLAYDLTTLPSTAEGCQRVAADNPAVSNFVQAANRLFG